MNEWKLLFAPNEVFCSYHMNAICRRRLPTAATPSWIYILNANHKYAHKRFQFDFIKAILFTNQDSDVNIILKFDRDLVGQLDFTVDKILMFKYNVVLYA